MISRRLSAVVLILTGAAGITACLLSASSGMRDVMRTDGGSCASGGPYVVARQCSGGDIRLLMVGIIGGLACAAVYAGGTSAFGRSPTVAGLLAWTAMFGLLGWNFVSLGTHPGGSQAGSGWLISGAVFWALALGGLIPAIGIVGSDLRSGGLPDPVVQGMQPLVRAYIPPGLPGAQQGTADGWDSLGAGRAMPGSSFLAPVLGSGQGIGAPSPPIARAGGMAAVLFWLVSSLAGVVAGIAISGPLITALR